MIKYEENPVIENNFNNHAPCYPGQTDKYELIRAKAKELAYLIEDICPKSREASLAMTNLEQVVFWANASVARYVPKSEMNPSMSSDAWVALEKAFNKKGKE